MAAVPAVIRMRTFVIGGATMITMIAVVAVMPSAAVYYGHTAVAVDGAAMAVESRDHTAGICVAST